MLATGAALFLALGTPVSGVADELVLPQAVERNQSIEVVYRLEHPTTGHGFLDVEWSDVDRRVIERRRVPVDLSNASQLAFPLDTGRALTMKNQLAAHLSFDGVEQRGSMSHLGNGASRSFIVSPSDHPWTDFQIIMWQDQTRAGYAAQTARDHGGDGAPRRFEHRHGRTDRSSARQ